MGRSLDRDTMTDGSARIVSTDELQATVEGDIPSQAAWWKQSYTFGAHPESISGNVIMEHGTYISVPTPSGICMNVISTITGDVMVGPGAHTAYLDYLSTDYTAKTVEIILSGATVVNTFNTLPNPANDIYRVNAFGIKTVGTEGANIGYITLKSPDNTVLYKEIKAGKSVSSPDTLYTVPKGKALYITSIEFTVVSTGSNAPVICTAEATYDREGKVALKAGTRFKEFHRVVIDDAANVRRFEVPIKFPAGTDIKCSATTQSGTAAVTVGMFGYTKTV